MTEERRQELLSKIVKRKRRKNTNFELTAEDIAQGKLIPSRTSANGNRDAIKEKLPVDLSCIASGTYTLQEIATTLGVTRERVRQIEAGALKKLRHPKLRKYWVAIAETIADIQIERAKQQL